MRGSLRRLLTASAAALTVLGTAGVYSQTSAATSATGISPLLPPPAAIPSANPATASSAVASALTAPPKGTEYDATACAWMRHVDGRDSGFGFNSRNAGYLGLAMFDNLPGGHWRFRGTYPKARWFSFESYDRLLASQGSVSSQQIDPDNRRLTNPFLPRGTAQLGKDTYTVDMYDRPPAQRDPHAHNVLYGGYRQNRVVGGLMHMDSEAVLMRTYDAPDSTDTFGGVARPRVEWVVDDPRTTAIRSDQQACLSIYSAGMAFEPWAVVAGTSEDINKPLIKPFIVPTGQLVQGSIDPRNPPYPVVFRPSSNGYQNLFFNSRTPYFAVLPNKAVGPVLRIRFKAPTFARIEDGQKPTGREQVAYWEWCTTQWLTPVNYTIACRSDDQFHIDRHGYVTLAISTADQRPRVDGKPYADWLPMAGNLGFALMRTLDPNRATYPQSPMFLPPVATVAGVEPPADAFIGPTSEKQIRTHMGIYYPDMVYCTRAEFEKDECDSASARPTDPIVGPLTAATLGQIPAPPAGGVSIPDNLTAPLSPPTPTSSQ